MDSLGLTYGQLIANEVDDPVDSSQFPQQDSSRRAKRLMREARRLKNFQNREIVAQSNGQARQAGATTAEGEYIKVFRSVAEENLFIFSHGIMGRSYMTGDLHLPVCNFVQECPPFRKLVLMPREHAKTSIVSHCLPAHILIQKAENNIYFPGLDGCECRILLAGETEGMASKNLRVVESVFTGNSTFRAIWPERCWQGNPKRHGAKWSDKEMEIPRQTAWPDPSVKAIGVGGAITGARPNVLIKDDLISFAAANSDAVMLEAIDWHKVSRALLEEYEKESGLHSLEFIVGTRWAVFDLYSYIMDNDPSVEVIDSKYHAIIKDGVILWPERITEKFIEQKRREFGSMYFLLYLNSAADPSLTDFDTSLIRGYKFEGGNVVFEEDERDVYLEERANEVGEEGDKARVVPVGLPFNSSTYDMIVPRGRGDYFRIKYG